MNEEVARWCGVRHWIRGSLQRQLAVVAALLILVASGIFLLVVTQQYKSSILRVQEQASMNVNLLLQSALENAMIKRDLEGLQDIVARLGAQDNVTGVMIANPQGEIRFSSYPDQVFKTLSDDAFSRARRTGERQAGFRELDTGEQVLRSINPVRNKPRCKECHGAALEHPINGLLIVDYDASNVGDFVWRGALMLAGLGIAVLVFLEAGLWLAIYRLILTRLNRLAATTRALAAGDLSVRTGADGADELAQLGAGFDEMATRLETNVEDLRTAQVALQTLIDAIPDGVRVIDQDFQIVMANNAYCRQIGADAETIEGQLCYASSHKRDRPCVPTLVCCPVEQVLRQGQSGLTCGHTHVDAEGTDLSVEISAAAVTLRIDGRDQRCVVESIRDMESDLSISQKQRLAEMGSLAAGIAHEVHNPLSSISLVLKSLKSQDTLSEEMKQLVQIAETEIGNCQSITESLLRLSALPQGEQELVDMAPVIHDTASLLNFEAKQAGVAIVKTIDGRPRVLARDSDIRNLVFNLALNAIHAMPSGGELRFVCRAEDERVRLEVIDTGVGISRRDQAKILLPFWTRRADGSRGRGLGLAICSSIVKHLGGSLTFTSQVGVGTRFTVDLPNAGEGSA
ncbi:sensor histidine kinase [Marimonas arenosa]|uniref:histidine kinase n=1 Tax=Marimonas arenosa TaxID=1795305 RepID=A0AAE4B356_9RHOB|nr:ATP-binding protein [Marimonas arenosa]MDQ2088925.1 ATP-binding protein [Marimonas arenosa]